MKKSNKKCCKKQSTSNKNTNNIERVKRKCHLKNSCKIGVGKKNVKKKSAQRKLYTTQALKNAIEAYNTSHSLSIRTVARTYGIPPATLSRKIKNPHTEEKKSGPPTVLSYKEESEIVSLILDRAAMGFPVTKEDLFDAVEKYITSTNKLTPFKKNRPGRHWYEGFRKRHPNLTIRTPQHLSHRRAEATREDLQEWFSEQKDYLISKNLLDISPTRVFNCDETNISLCHKSNKVLAGKGARSAYVINDDSKAGITALMMYSAAGTRAPPMIMYPYKQEVPKIIVEKTPKGWGIGISENGWMTLETFFEYITNIFHPWLVKEKIEFPVIIYLDNHSSHLTIPLVKFCREKKIELIGLCPNATHIMQPLDTAFFHPFKAVWSKIVPKWKNENNKEFKKEDFGIVLKKALDSMPEESIIKHGFKACGLVPFDPTAVEYDILNKRSSKSKKSLDQSASVHSEESNDQHLHKFDEKIKQTSPDLFQQFEDNLPTGVWTGNIEKKALFEYWFEMKSPKVG